ncbi:uncharacterized protein LOC117337098 [Pecten maximus]|uniref:uncharacterized protein LOC117337098 n=1 Tax=Pecten maximus TaxID=6579 RepID=UPI001458EAE5|nr:uncharacterized protein LOC117337098 [Pecten maximus]
MSTRLLCTFGTEAGLFSTFSQLVVSTDVMEIIKDLLKIKNTNFLAKLVSITFILFCLLDCIIAAEEIRMFKSSLRNNLQNMTLPTRKLWTITNLTTTFRCAEHCKNDDACVSFFYNNDSHLCEGHSITLGVTNGSIPAVGNKYYVDEDGEGYIGDACTTSSDCYVTDSECRGGACWCSPGYSFWPSSRSCAANCTIYGTDYTEVSNHFLIQNNEEAIQNITFETCVQSCISVTLYTCVTFEFGWQTNDCFLQSVTKLDKPDKWYEDQNDRGFVHYQRDCV